MYRLTEFVFLVLGNSIGWTQISQISFSMFPPNIGIKNGPKLGENGKINLINWYSTYFTCYQRRTALPFFRLSSDRAPRPIFDGRALPRPSPTRAQVFFTFFKFTGCACLVDLPTYLLNYYFFINFKFTRRACLVGLEIN